MEGILKSLWEIEPVAKLSFLLVIIAAGLLFLVIRQHRRLRELRHDLQRRLDRLRQDWVGRAEQQLGELAKRMEDMAEENQRAVEEVARVDREVEEVGLEMRSSIAKVNQFEEQFQTVYRTELKRALKSFDSTLVTVLGEMKNELKRGVSRIEEIQSVVAGKGALEHRLHELRLVEGEGEEGAEKEAPPPAPPAPPAGGPEGGR